MNRPFSILLITPFLCMLALEVRGCDYTDKVRNISPTLRSEFGFATDFYYLHETNPTPGRGRFPLPGWYWDARHNMEHALPYHPFWRYWRHATSKHDFLAISYGQGDSFGLFEDLPPGTPHSPYWFFTISHWIPLALTALLASIPLYRKTAAFIRIRRTRGFPITPNSPSN